VREEGVVGKREVLNERFEKGGVNVRGGKCVETLLAIIISWNLRDR
jgi:hypothetical protein